MADEIIPAGGQMPPAANITPGLMPSTGQQMLNQPPSDGDPNTPAEIAKLREENKQRRLALEAANAKLEQIERDKLGELEKAQKDAAKHQQDAQALRQKLQEVTVRSAIERAAGKLHFNDPEDAFAMLMRSGDLEYDDDGTPKNTDKLLKALAESKPYLIQPQSSSQPQAGVFPANPSRSGQSAQPDWKNPATIKSALMDPNNWKK